MLIKLMILAACLFACSYGLLNCAHQDSRRVNLIYNGTSVHACRNGEEKLEGCIIHYELDPQSRVIFVPIRYMIETYEHIWDIYNYTGDRSRQMFEKRNRMYQDCAEIFDLIFMQNYTYREFDQVLEHFKTAYKAFMPDGKLPENIPEPEKEKTSFHTENEHLATGFYNSDDDDEFDYSPVQYVKHWPIYNISICNIQVMYGSDTFLVHSGFSMHYCDREQQNFIFTTCSNTSRPEQTLKCLSISDDAIEQVELALNESKFIDMDKSQSQVANLMKLNEVWDAKEPCMKTIKKMQQRGWNPIFDACFARRYDFEVQEIPDNEL